MKKALITGITGQDGSYLAEFLVEKGYQVFGMARRTSIEKYDRIGHLLDKIELVQGDLFDQTSLDYIIERIMPDEVYNLAAQSFVPTSWTHPAYTSEITGVGATRILESIRKYKRDAKFYQASSSEMFGKAQQVPQNEKTPFYPRSPYGIAKVYAHYMTINYRESYNMFAVSGICFNHESPRRGLEFVTRKITHGVARIKLGLADEIKLGNLDAKRDWGYAKDYVEAMWLMLQQKEAEDYVVATGKTHSVRDCVEVAFKEIDIDVEWQGKGLDEKGIDKKTGKLLVEISPQYYRPAEVDFLVGDSSKAREKLGWTPKVSFNKLIKIMVKAELSLFEK